MRRGIGTAITTAIAIGFGLITLIGLLVTDENAADREFLDLSTTVTDLLLRLVVITIAVTILIGIFNLLSVHLGRIQGGKGGWYYSLILVLSMAAVITVTALERADVITPEPNEPANSEILLESVQISIESALAGLLLFALVYGATRMMHRRVSWWAILFTTVLLVILVGALPVADLSAVTDARDWLLSVPVSAGARGILLGIALATVVTGVRVLIGQDRSYRE